MALTETEELAASGVVNEHVVEMIGLSQILASCENGGCCWTPISEEAKDGCIYPIRSGASQ